MYVIRWKFLGFLAVLFIVVVLSIWGRETKYADGLVGGLTTLLAGMGRDLYRSTTGELKEKDHGSV